MNILQESQKKYHKFLNALAELLDITPAQFQKAKKHYESVGDWLSKEDSPLHKHSPQIYPQGSFRLGTVIKPISGEDEFDVDLVCQLKLNRSQVTQEALKNMVGERLRAKPDYKRMLKNKEGQRCWTLDYQETPKFHMDILPAIHDNYNQLLLIGVDLEYAKHAICITDNKSKTYQILSYNWQKSNPIGYANWFRDQMKVQFGIGKKNLAASRNVSVETIKEEEVKTPLQRAIQILKRHRDIMFGDDKDRPISIIITTLAAKAYSEEENLYFALKNILDKMQTFISVVNGVSVVENPVNPSENFADKWIDFPQRETNFKAWIVKAREDIYKLIERNGLEGSVDNLKEVFGKNIVNQALNKAGLSTLNKSSVPTVGAQFLSTPHKQKPSWPIILTSSVSIAARYKDENGWHTITPKTVISKEKNVLFAARTNVKKPFSVYWQVVNTGEEARNSRSLRGEIFPSKTAGAGGLQHRDRTAYRGTHWAECYIVKDGICVARSNEIFVKVA